MISIIIPVIRPDKAIRCCKAIKENSGIPESLYEIVTEEDIKRIGAPMMVKKMTDSCRGELVCFLGDDTIPQEGFLRYALEAMATLPEGWGVVGFNDNLYEKGKAPTHWLADKRMLPLLGGEFFHVGYRHCWCDNELWVRASELGKSIFCPRAFIYHDHVLVDQKNYDVDYQRVYSYEWMSHDVILFRKRKRNNWQTPKGS